MSRAGKYPVGLKDGVTAAIVDNAIVIKGPKGELKVPVDTKHSNLIDVKVEAGQVVVTPNNWFCQRNVHERCWL